MLSFISLPIMVLILLQFDQAGRNSIANINLSAFGALLPPQPTSNPVS